MTSPTTNLFNITIDYHHGKSYLNLTGGDLASPEVVVHPKAWKSGRSLVWFRTSACHADDPGSNLGDRTNLSAQATPYPI
jgi:hypothetical protein